MQRADAGRQPFDGFERVADGLPHEQRVGADQAAVEQNGRRARLAGVAAEADADVARVAQGVAQTVGSGGAYFLVAPVDVKGN